MRICNKGIEMDTAIPWFLSKDYAGYSAVLGLLFLYKILKGLINEAFWYIKTYSPAFYRPNNYLDIYGDWAAVTGCTGGIGLALSYELASRGINVVLISRSKVKLEALAKDIEAKYNVKTKVIVNDAFCRESTNRMANELSQLNIGILVNNVGIHYEGAKGRLDEASRECIQNMLTVNTGNSAMTLKHVLPNMIANRRGIVINICSSSSYFPVPMQSLYSATKVYLDVLTKALGYELSMTGVEIQSVCPLLVQSSMTQDASIYIYKFLSISGDTFARSTVNIFGTCERTAGYWLSDLSIGVTKMLVNPTLLIYILYYAVLSLKYL